ncbi:hypothetical protein WL21_01340 [Burkholderia ubonensis]|uniref:hypothetical protein n=1 Tax=Burkholderia ubonensis TaxID=101571 RepID=UPI000756ED5C|nr:hypothetical protein [Burkholderia ubonensis]KVO99335.1 hypothetical protein WJ81_29820 [Burkholderia ubonensis]KVZ55648.1 hypothetical protein WL20_26425 [Burkholderia ubonensis]KVZ68669.1 hypothetical protein WL21_01340 [Burkholderia ubonensis]OJA63551.1 hypothetical protein BGV68_02855 [Burkholderia ubonensis]
MMRNQAMTGDRANMMSAFGIDGLIAGLSDIESGINVAVGAMNRASRPEQKTKAGWKLMERKRRLELQPA